MSAPQIDVVVVVVPVHDEEALLGRCLAALEGAVATAREAGIRCVVRVVLDDCSDGSAAIAARHAVEAVAISEACVGAARAAGIHSALDALADVDRGRVWIANTDADSAVPPNWVAHQVHLANTGADVVLGTVRADPADLSNELAALRQSEYMPGVASGNVHAANLGLRATTYVDAEGFADIAEHEDIDLVSRCRAIGAVVTPSDGAEVLTSGRLVGRTPGGYAGFLRQQQAQARQLHA